MCTLLTYTLSNNISNKVVDLNMIYVQYFTNFSSTISHYWWMMESDSSFIWNKVYIELIWTKIKFSWQLLYVTLVTNFNEIVWGIRDQTCRWMDVWTNGLTELHLYDVILHTLWIECIKMKHWLTKKCWKVSLSVYLYELYEALARDQQLKQKIWSVIPQHSYDIIIKILGLSKHFHTGIW
jgi:hypothetical protein